MLWLKCSFILMVLSSSVFADKFDSKECLDAKFETTIAHDGRFFGLIKNSLSIKKDMCTIEILFKEILEKKWVIDVCREPIHMKITSRGSQEVQKRTSECSVGNDNEYCSEWQELKAKLQDYGLIFANGEREVLSTSHGQTYCSYLLLHKHLGDGVLFSKYDKVKNIFNKTEIKKNVINENEVLPNIESTTSEDKNQKVEILNIDTLKKSEDQF